MPATKQLGPPPNDSANAESPANPRKHNRSRGGCTRCRKRRQKCDEQRPACTRCRENLISKCEYTVNLQWGGRNFQSYAQNSNIKKLETEPGTFVYVASSKPKPFKTSPSDRLGRSLSPLDPASSSTKLLLHHFATSASRITSCHTSIQSSFCELLLPMATSYPPLLSAVMALSAIHRNSLFTLPSSSPLHSNMSNEIISLKASSITQLRSELLVPNVDKRMRDAVLATALTLCMCEIHSGADQPRSWRLHLEGAKAILGHGEACPTSQNGLLERWYTSIEALAAISENGLRADYVPPITSPAHAMDGMQKSDVSSGEERLVFLDDYFGFSTDLVQILKQIGALASERRVMAEANAEHVLLSEEDLQTRALILESRIASMISRDCETQPTFYPGVREKLLDEVAIEFYLSNQAYQYSALLHIYRKVMALERVDERVQKAVKRILECAEGIRPREGLSPYIVLTMPLFTAGREALGEDRDVVRNMIGELGQRLGLRNVWRSLEFLEVEWAGVGEGQGGRNCDFIPY